MSGHHDGNWNKENTVLDAQGRLTKFLLFLGPVYLVGAWKSRWSCLTHH